MAMTAEERQQYNNLLEALNAGAVDQDTIKLFQQWARRNDKERKAAAARQRMKDCIPARITDLYPIDFDRQDLTEIGQAKKFALSNSDRIRYTDEYGWLFYEREPNGGGHWRKNALERVKQLYHNFNDDQVHEALNMLADAPDNKSDEAAQAEKFLSFSLRMRTAGAVGRILEQAHPYVMTHAEELDSDPYKLNTPSGVVDLRTGKIRPSTPADLCTHITSCGLPDEATSSAAAQIWQEFLNQLTDGDTDLESYLMQIVGRAAFGIVKGEELVILYGNGGNGKSTFINAISAVMGDYSVTYDGEALMDTNSNSRQFDLARLHGARLAVFTELKENRTLDTATLKHIASTDRIHAAIKYQMPFDFAPSHSPFLFSNHLPRVNARDEGTWRRLKIAPFNHRFTNTSGQKLNYGDELFTKAGGVILSWIINGAMLAAANDFMIEEPACVKELIRSYRIESDWLMRFFESECDIFPDDPSQMTKTADLYDAYEVFSKKEGSFTVSRTAFRSAVKSNGFEIKRHNTRGDFYQGILLKRGLSDEVQDENSRNMAENG